MLAAALRICCRVSTHLHRCKQKLFSCQISTKNTLKCIIFQKVAAESFVHRKLRHKLFGVTADDKAGDDALARRIDSLGFLTPQHLDVQSLKGLDNGDGERLRRGVGVARAPR